MNPAYATALAALVGSMIGASTTFATTWITQRAQYRSQQKDRELTRRETLFGDFIDEAAARYAEALTRDLDDPAKLVLLYGILSKIRLFASPKTIDAATAVMRHIIDAYNSTNISSTEVGRTIRHGHSFLEEFTQTCRDELYQLP